MSSTTEPLRGTRLIRPAPSGLLERLGELWDYRWLLRWFGWQSIRGLYANTWLGWIWIPLRPAFNVFVRGLIFGIFLAVSTGDVPYLLFFAGGLAIWEMFAQGWYIGTRALELNRRYLRRIYVPRLIVLFSSQARGLVWFVMYVLIFIIFLVYYWIADGTFYVVIGPNLLYAVAAFVMVLAMSTALSAFTSVYSLEARDPRFLVRFALSLWFYVTPVIYPLSAVPPDLKFVTTLNPMTAPMELFRMGLFGEGNLPMLDLAVSLVTIALLVPLGAWFFNASESRVLDHL